MMMVLAAGLTGCGSKTEGGGTDTMKDPAAGNWYIVDGSDIRTLKLDGAGGGSLSGDSVSYSVDGDTVSLTIDGETVTVTMGDSEYGEVLKDDEGVIFAYRDKSAAKEIAAGGGAADLETVLLGEWYSREDDGIQVVTFKEDGTADLWGVPVEYTLTGDTVTMNTGASTYDFHLVEDSEEGWVIENDSNILLWKDRARAEAGASSAQPPAETAVAGQEYIGVWDGEKITYNGQTMSMTDTGMTFSIEIKADGTATATTNGEPDGSATWKVNEDGTLTLTDNTGELDPFFIDSDDYLHVVLQADEGEMVFYCKKR